MEHLHITPDLLAAITAEGLMRGGSDQSSEEPAGPRIKLRWRRRVHRWLDAKASAASVFRQSARQLTLDDEWAGGWWARSRKSLTQALSRV